MSTKINVAGIVRDHFATLTNERTSKTSRVDIAAFFVVPGAVGVLSFYSGFYLSHEAITVLIAALAVFSGLLVNVLVLIYGLTDAASPGEDNKKGAAAETSLRFLREIFANLSFAILVAVLCILLLSLLMFARGVAARFLTALLVAGCLNFLLTFLMALKRIHVLLRNRFPS